MFTDPEHTEHRAQRGSVTQVIQTTDVRETLLVKRKNICRTVHKSSTGIWHILYTGEVSGSESRPIAKQFAEQR